MTSHKLLILAAAMTGLSLLTGCASSQKAGGYQSGQVQQVMKIRMATVVDVREVKIEAPSSSVGSTSGAVLGASAGSFGSRKGLMEGIAGALVGGVAGSLVESVVTKRTGLEITYQPDGTNDLEAMVQEKDEQGIKPGDRIRLVQSDSVVRAVKIAQGGAK